MKDNYHELLKRVINNENEIEDMKSREEHLKHELENVKKYMTCQMEELNDITIDKLNDTKAALIKTRISFTQSLKLLNETMQELSHRQPEKLKCEENQTECNCTGSFLETIISPGYPIEYSNNLAKNWSIDVGSGYRARLQFTNFTTERTYDVVKVFDAVDATDLMGFFSGDDLPPPMISTGRYMFLTFTTDHNVQYTGFSANVYKITSTKDDRNVRG
ncbi:membrane frizzled-related protein-like [Mytilus trossulus]|uniref:membrane frizzled-related protein-like n=1 Tax=Mytilus trossulus TaxID=6551 RepID=UPI003003AA74